MTNHESRSYIAQHNTTNVHALIKFFSQWLNSEASFIFWLVILNLTVSKVNYTFFLKDFLSARTEFLILACDTAIISLTVMLTDFVIYFVFRKTKTLFAILKAVLISLSALTFVVDIFTLYYYNLPFNEVMFEIITYTNLRESSEFLQTYLMNPKPFLFAALIFMIVYLLHRIFILISKSKKLLTFIVLCLLFMGIFTSSREIYTGRGPLRIINSFSLYRLSFLTLNHYDGVRNIQKMSDEAPEVILTKNNSTIPYVVFILGESTNRNHMSLYGYELKTNPKLETRKIYVFGDTVSPYSSTAISMQNIFTFCRIDSPDEWYTYTDLFSILRSAGYYTFWLSNQENAPGWKVTGFYPLRCDYAEFTEKMKEDMYRGSAYDESLLGLLDNALNSNHDKNFYLLHLMGAHFHYQKRYPERFSFFLPGQENIKPEGISDSERAIRARYDNAVLYNDYIIDEIIRRFEDKNAIVIYISDHGEEVFDEAGFFGHAITLTKNMLEIPFIIWVSDKFSKAYPEIEQRIASSVHRPYITDDMIHTVLDIMSIETPEYDPAKSVINPSFDITRPRIYGEYIYTKDGGFSALQ